MRKFKAIPGRGIVSSQRITKSKSKKVIASSFEDPYYRVYDGYYEDGEWESNNCVNSFDTEEEAIRYADSKTSEARNEYYSVVYTDIDDEYTEEIYHTYPD